MFEAEEVVDQANRTHESILTKEVLEGKDVSGLVANKDFRDKLNKIIHVRDDDNAKKQFKLYQRYVLPLRWLIVIVYLVVIPIFEAPSWCLEELDGDERWHFKVDCSNRGVPGSEIMKLNTSYASMFDIFCIVFFLLSRLFRKRYLVTLNDIKDSERPA